MVSRTYLFFIGIIFRINFVCPIAEIDENEGEISTRYVFCTHKHIIMINFIKNTSLYGSRNKDNKHS